MYEKEKKLFLPLAKDLIKSKGSCFNFGRYAFDCKECYYHLVRTNISSCLTDEVYKFSLNFIEENKNQQLEFDFK